MTPETQVQSLIYHNGNEMKVDPAYGGTLREVAFKLRAGQHVDLVLEPGDATRYDISITPRGAHRGVDQMDLLVTRTRGSDVVGTMMTCIAEHPSMLRQEVKRSLADNNEWTEMFLSWWMEKLLNLLDADRTSTPPESEGNWRDRALEAETALVGLKSINWKEGEPLDITMSGEAVKAFASMAIDWFKVGGGKNYLEAKVVDPREPRKQYAIIVQALGADFKSPVDFRLEAEFELKDAVSMMRKAVNTGSLEPVKVWLGVNRQEG